MFTCQDTFAVGCIVSHNAQHHRQTDGRTDRQTDDSIVPIADG